MIDLALLQLPVRPRSLPFHLAIVAAGVWLFLTGAGLEPAAAASAFGHGLVVKDVDERADGVTFTVELGKLREHPTTVLGQAFVEIGAAGFGRTSEPGKPALPFRTFTIAVPPDGEPTVEVSVLASESLSLVPAPAPEHTMEKASGDEEATPGIKDAIDQAFYGGSGTYPERLYATQAPSWLRRQRVLDVTVYPVRYDAGAKRLVVAQQLVVRVRFGRAGSRGLGAMPAMPAPYERGFESIYRNSLLNYESARSFRAGPPTRAGLETGQRVGGSDAIRITIKNAGPYRVTYTELSAAGLPAALPIDNLALSERRYVDGPPPTQNFVNDVIPILVDDSGQPGVFDGNDAILFYARTFRQRERVPHLQKYTDDNVVWLDWSSPGGARITPRSGWFEPQPAQSPANFPDTLHFEEDRIGAHHAPHSFANPAYLARERVVPWYTTRHFPLTGEGGNPLDPYCSAIGCRSYLFPYQLVDVDPSTNVIVTAQLVSGVDQVTHLVTFVVRSGSAADTVLNRKDFSGHQAIGVLSDTAAATLFTRPGSQLEYIGERIPFGSTEIIHPAGAFLDWWELGYQHLYRARNDRLAFNSGNATGPAEFAISGFTSSNIVLIDVTDMFNPTVLTGTQTSGSGPFTLRFRDDLSAGPRRYVALARTTGGLQTTAGALTLVHPTAIASPAVEPDYIIVVPDVADIDGDGSADDFPVEAERLKQHRESKGHVVQIHRLSEIYNEFDGGLARSTAIRNYMRHAFSHWTRPPLYLLLAGDGSEDFRNKMSTGLSVVPTELIYGPVIDSDVSDYQLVTADTWFVCGIAPGDSEFDDHMDLAVGRLPAQSAGELRSMIDKTIAYENFDPDDRWRSRNLVISDDGWSSSISFTQPYRPQAGEPIFEAISDTLNSIVENRSGIGDLIDSRAVKLRVYTDQLPPNPCPGPPDPCRGVQLAIDHVDATASPILYQLISDGNLLVNYQGHANAFQLAHERLFWSEGTDLDQNRFNNLGRPGIWMVYACHPNQFGYREERVGNVVGGRERGFGELLLSLENRGAVAAFGSTGFEYLPTGLGAGPPYSLDLNTPQWEAFYLSPPEPDSTGPRWILGEVLNVAKELYGQVDAGKGPIFTYCLLGDPALRVDAFAPSFAVTAADTVRAPGGRIESFSAKSDTVTIVAEIRDEVHVATTEVRELVGSQSIVIDPQLYTLEEVDRHQIRLTYAAPLRPENYDIIVRSRDASGRQVEFPLAVRVDAAFRADGTPLATGDFLASVAALEVDVHSPVGLDDQSFRLLRDGVPLTGLNAEATDPLGKYWRLSAILDSGPGPHTLGLEIRHGGNQVLVHTISYQVGGEFALRQVGTYPNPFDTFTTFSYQLTAPADEVQIQIYTVSGRLVHEIEAPRGLGYTQIAWNGLDQDHDEVANGLYIFRVTARGGGNKEEFTGRIVRARQ